MRWVALALLLSPWAARPARAQADARVELTWSAPAGCPSQTDLEADVARRLGRVLASDGPVLRALAEVEVVEAGFRLVLVTELEREAGRRVLEAPRCEELASAASVIVALLADPHADATPKPTPPPPEPPPPDPVEEREPASAEPDDEEDEEEEPEEPETLSPPIVVRVSVRPELIADLGTMPALGVGPALSLGLRLDRTAIELSGNYLPPNHVERDERDLGTIKLWSAGLGVCHAFGRKNQLGPCLRAEYGRMSGEGDDQLRMPGRGGTGAFAAVLLGLRFDAPVLPALTLCAEIAAGLPLARTLFRVEGVGDVHESAVVIGRVRTGAELRF
jgi:hypothetical protein